MRGVRKQRKKHWRRRQRLWEQMSQWEMAGWVGLNRQRCRPSPLRRRLHLLGHSRVVAQRRAERAVGKDRRRSRHKRCLIMWPRVLRRDSHRRLLLLGQGGRRKEAARKRKGQFLLLPHLLPSGRTRMPGYLPP